MYLIIGLGNPGEKYKNNKHNIGFKFIDAIATKSKLSFKSKFTGLFTKDVSANIILFKPMNYMNDSGLAVNKIKNFFKIKAEDIFVIYDDIDLELGKIKIKKGGGNAGHNGIKSIEQHLQENFFKIRIGISRPSGEMSISNYVLSNFNDGEGKELRYLIEYVSDNLGQLLQKDFVIFLNYYYAELANRNSISASSVE